MDSLTVSWETSFHTGHHCMCLYCSDRMYLSLTILTLTLGVSSVILTGRVGRLRGEVNLC